MDLEPNDNDRADVAQLKALARDLLKNGPKNGKPSGRVDIGANATAASNDPPELITGATPPMTPRGPLAGRLPEATKTPRGERDGIGPGTVAPGGMKVA